MKRFLSITNSPKLCNNIIIRALGEMMSCRRKKLTANQSVDQCRKSSNSDEATLLGDTKMPLGLLVEDYLKNYNNFYQNEKEWWGDKTLSRDGVLERAWTSRYADRKMHPHQRRVSSKLAQGLRVSREYALQPEHFETFEELYDWVEKIVSQVNGLGAMTAYDVAQRLGMWLDLSPNVVYLHRGTADAAKKFGIEGKMAPLSAFPSEIQALGCAHAENFLCIYKSKIQKL